MHIQVFLLPIHISFVRYFGCLNNKVFLLPKLIRYFCYLHATYIHFMRHFCYLTCNIHTFYEAFLLPNMQHTYILCGTFATYSYVQVHDERHFQTSRCKENIMVQLKIECCPKGKSSPPCSHLHALLHSKSKLGVPRPKSYFWHLS